MRLLVAATPACPCICCASTLRTAARTRVWFLSMLCGLCPYMGHITASQHGLDLSALYVLQQGGKQPDWWRDNIGREVAQSAPQPAPQSGSRQEFEQNLGKGVRPACRMSCHSLLLRIIVWDVPVA